MEKKHGLTDAEIKQTRRKAKKAASELTQPDTMARIVSVVRAQLGADFNDMAVEAGLSMAAGYLHGEIHGGIVVTAPDMAREYFVRGASLAPCLCSNCRAGRDAARQATTAVLKRAAGNNGAAND